MRDPDWDGVMKARARVDRGDVNWAAVDAVGRGTDLGQPEATVTAQEDYVNWLRARVAALEAALAPFVPDAADTDGLQVLGRLTFADLARARGLLGAGR